MDSEYQINSIKVDPELGPNFCDAEQANYSYEYASLNNMSSNSLNLNNSIASSSSSLNNSFGNSEQPPFSNVTSPYFVNNYSGVAGSGFTHNAMFLPSAYNYQQYNQPLDVKVHEDYLQAGHVQYYDQSLCNDVKTKDRKIAKKEPQKKRSPRKRNNRFDGLSEEEVLQKLLPDHLDHNLDILIIGINPGLFAAHKGHHYAGPGNHFWKCLFMSGITSEAYTAYDDVRMLEFGIGFTNIVARTTRGSQDLSRKEIEEGGKILLTKLQYYKPKIAVFNGKGIYEIYSKKKDCMFGKQPETVEGTNTHIWVMPSSSARCSQLPRAVDKLPFYTALKKFRDYLNGTIPSISEEEMVFKNLTLKSKVAQEAQNPVKVER